MKGVPFWRVPAARARYRFELLPILAPEDMPEDGKALCQSVQADFRERFARWLHARGRAAEPERAEPTADTSRS